MKLKLIFASRKNEFWWFTKLSQVYKDSQSLPSLQDSQNSHMLAKAPNALHVILVLIQNKSIETHEVVAVWKEA